MARSASSSTRVSSCPVLSEAGDSTREGASGRRRRRGASLDIGQNGLGLRRRRLDLRWGRPTGPRLPLSDPFLPITGPYLPWTVHFLPHRPVRRVLIGRTVSRDVLCGDVLSGLRGVCSGCGYVVSRLARAVSGCGREGRFRCAGRDGLPTVPVRGILRRRHPILLSECAPEGGIICKTDGIGDFFHRDVLAGEQRGRLIQSHPSHHGCRGFIQ